MIKLRLKLFQFRFNLKMSDRKVPFKKLNKKKEPQVNSETTSNKIIDDLDILEDSSFNTSYQTLLQNSCNLYI